MGHEPHLDDLNLARERAALPALSLSNGSFRPSSRQAGKQHQLRVCFASGLYGELNRVPVDTVVIGLTSKCEPHPG
ncbi:hypothetical protein BH20CHL3_BH20CHL3_07230 [soil metagenome]